MLSEFKHNFDSRPKPYLYSHITADGQSYGNILQTNKMQEAIVCVKEYGDTTLVLSPFIKNSASVFKLL